MVIIYQQQYFFNENIVISIKALDNTLTALQSENAFLDIPVLQHFQEKTQ